MGLLKRFMQERRLKNLSKKKLMSPTLKHIHSSLNYILIGSHKPILKSENSTKDLGGGPRKVHVEKQPKELLESPVFSSKREHAFNLRNECKSSAWVSSCFSSSVVHSFKYLLLWMLQFVWREAMFGVGALVFDSIGRPMVVMQGFHSAFSSVLSVEAQAILEGIRLAQRMRLRQIKIYFDSLFLCSDAKGGYSHRVWSPHFDYRYCGNKEHIHLRSIYSYS